jgi:CheY-like chemotaxis protein
MESGRLAPLKVVVVDDDPQVRDVISRCLIRFGASVTQSEDAFEGVSAVKSVRPDLAIVDLNMPSRDGFDFLDDIKMLGPEHGGNVPVIVMTGVHDPDLETATREAGFAYHLIKPFAPVQLFRSITQTLKRSSPLEESRSAFPLLAHSVPLIGWL